MTAQESQLPAGSAGSPSWLSLAQNVFNDVAVRWDTSTCGGGLHWQIFEFNNGYNYKNSISAGAFFQLASRLARYTGNATYSEWAERAYSWTAGEGLIDNGYNVYDGASVTVNCTEISRIQLSYVSGTFITGAAHMYNTTNGSQIWKTRLDGLVNQTLSVFFESNNDVLSEVSCEPKTCSTNMSTFKGLLAAWLATTTQMAPYTNKSIMEKLKSTAKVAAAQCNGGASGTSCGLTWREGVTNSDGLTGLGQELSALNVVQALLIGNATAPATAATGSGTSSTGNGTSTGSGTSSQTSSGPSSTGTSKSSATSRFDAAAVWVFTVVGGAIVFATYL